MFSSNDCKKIKKKNSGAKHCQILKIQYSITEPKTANFLFQILTLKCDLVLRPLVG